MVMTSAYLSSNRSENVIGWKIVARKSQAFVAQRQRFSSAPPIRATPPSGPPFGGQSNQPMRSSAKRVGHHHSDRGVWFGRRESSMGGDAEEAMALDYHSRVHSVTTLIMLTTVFVFVTTLASAAILVCWCRRSGDTRLDPGRRRRRRAFKAEFKDDRSTINLGVKDGAAARDDNEEEEGEEEEEEEEDYADEDDDDEDVETCEMREIVGRESRSDLSDFNCKSDNSDSDVDFKKSSSIKQYVKLPCDDEDEEEEEEACSNDPTSGRSNDAGAIRDPGHVTKIPGQSRAWSRSKLRLLSCVVPKFLRNLGRGSGLVPSPRQGTTFDFGDVRAFNDRTTSCYFVGREDRNPSPGVVRGFLFRLRAEMEPRRKEVLAMERNESNLSLLGV